MGDGGLEFVISERSVFLRIKNMSLRNEISFFYDVSQVYVFQFGK